MVVDTVQILQAEPGTIYELREGDILAPKGSSPHYIGLFEALAAGRMLGLNVTSDMIILAVEAHDCLTIGGAMHPAVEAAIEPAIRRIRELLEQPPG